MSCHDNKAHTFTHIHFNYSSHCSVSLPPALLSLSLSIILLPWLSLHVAKSSKRRANWLRPAPMPPSPLVNLACPALSSTFCFWSTNHSSVGSRFPSSFSSCLPFFSSYSRQHPPLHTWGKKKKEKSRVQQRGVLCNPSLFCSLPLLQPASHTHRHTPPLTPFPCVSHSLLQAAFILFILRLALCGVIRAKLIEH